MFSNSDFFLHVLEKNMDRLCYFNNGLDEPCISIEIEEYKLEVVLKYNLDIQVTMITDWSTNVSVYKNHHINNIFDYLYDKNIKRTIHNYLFRVVREYPLEELNYKRILTDFYYDVLDMIEGDQKSSLSLNFNNYTICVDNINKIDFYTIP